MTFFFLLTLLQQPYSDVCISTFLLALIAYFSLSYSHALLNHQILFTYTVFLPHPQLRRKGAVFQLDRAGLESAFFNEAIKESLCFPGASVDLSALIAKNK